MLIDGVQTPYSVWMVELKTTHTCSLTAISAGAAAEANGAPAKLNPLYLTLLCRSAVSVSVHIRVS